MRDRWSIRTIKRLMKLAGWWAYVHLASNTDEETIFVCEKFYVTMWVHAVWGVGGWPTYKGMRNGQRGRGFPCLVSDRTTLCIERVNLVARYGSGMRGQLILCEPKMLEGALALDNQGALVLL